MNTNKVSTLIMQSQVIQKRVSNIGITNLSPALKAKVKDYENLMQTVSLGFQKEIRGDTAIDRYLGDSNNLGLCSSIAEVGAINNFSEFIGYGDKIIEELDKR